MREVALDLKEMKSKWGRDKGGVDDKNQSGILQFYQMA